MFGLLGWCWVGLGLVGEEGLLKTNMGGGAEGQQPSTEARSRWLYGAVPSS